MPQKLTAVTSVAALRITKNGDIEVYHQPLPKSDREDYPPAEDSLKMIIEACPPKNGWICHSAQTIPAGPVDIQFIASVCAITIHGGHLRIGHSPIIFTRATERGRVSEIAEEILGKRYPATGWKERSVIVRKV